MTQFTEKELELINHLWSIKKGYLKDIVAQYTNSKPAYTTISTTLNRMIEKRHIDFTLKGRDKEYFPLISKTVYFTAHLNKLATKYFNKSISQFASFFTTNSNLSVKELEDLQRLVEYEINKKKKKI